MSDLQDIEISIENAEKIIELAAALKELKENSSFKKVLGDNYLREYAISLVNRKARLGFQDEKQQKYIEGQINAIGHLNQFFGFIEQEGAVAKEALKADQDERERILQEG